MPSSRTVVDYTGKELNENQIKECVVQLQELLGADKKFRSFRRDEAYMLRFLHCTNFNVHQAYRRVDDYYEHMCNYPDWYATSPPLENKSLIDTNTRAVLPGVRDNHGRRILIAKLGAMDATKLTPAQSARIDEYWLELIMDEPETQTTGLSIIMDMHGYSWRMFRLLTPTTLRIGTKKADLYPCKELVYHIVNTSMFFNASVTLIWPFLTSKLKERFHFHFNNWESLHKHIDPDVLPPEYGGKGPEFNISKLTQRLYDNNDIIAEKIKHQALERET